MFFFVKRCCCSLLAVGLLLSLSSCSLPTKEGRRHLVLGLGWVDLKKHAEQPGATINEYSAGGALISSGKEFPGLLIGYSSKKIITVEQGASLSYEHGGQAVYTDVAAVEYVRNHDLITENGNE